MQAREDLGRRLRDVVLANVDHGQHRTRRQEGVRPQFGTRSEVRVFVDTLAVFEERQGTPECIALVARHAGPAFLSLGLVAFEPRLDEHLVGQDHFGEQRVEVRARVVQALLIESAHDEQEGVHRFDQVQEPGIEGRLARLSLVLVRRVRLDELDDGVSRLLGFVHLGELVHARVRDLHGAERHPGLLAGRLGAGQCREQGCLAALGKPDECDFHSVLFVAVCRFRDSHNIVVRCRRPGTGPACRVAFRDRSIFRRNDEL